MRILALPDKQMQQLLASVELGFYSFGREVTAFCCEAINILALNIYNEAAKTGRKPKTQILAPFVNVSFQKFTPNYIMRILKVQNTKSKLNFLSFFS